MYIGLKILEFQLVHLGLVHTCSSEILLVLGKAFKGDTCSFLTLKALRVLPLMSTIIQHQTE